MGSMYLQAMTALLISLKTQMDSQGCVLIVYLDNVPYSKCYNYIL